MTTLAEALDCVTADPNKKDYALRVCDLIVELQRHHPSERVFVICDGDANFICGVQRNNAHGGVQLITVDPVEVDL